MKAHEKERLLYRILSGKTILKKSNLEVLAPDVNILYEAEDLYSEYYDKVGNLDKKTLRYELVNHGVVKLEDLKFLDIYSNAIESQQKELYVNFNSGFADQIRSLLRQTREKNVKILSDLAKFDIYSKESVANHVKSLHIIKNTCYRNSQKYDFYDKSPIIILEELNNLTISVSEIREIARNSSWTNIWFSLKGTNLFNSIPTLEQQLLLMWSKIYDNIRESDDSPSEEIIDDDDALDGWLILTGEERKRKKEQENIKKKFNSKINNAQEVFLIANSKEDIDRINKLNSEYASRIKNERVAQIYDRGQLHHHNFLDVRRDIQMEFTKMQAESIRGKKN